MKYAKDEPYADLFLCNGEVNFHEYYYIEEKTAPLDSLLYQVNRTGIETATPSLFHVERSSNTPWCEIFCIFSGTGSLSFRGVQYRLRPQQLVILPAGEAHVYDSDPASPLGMTWLEFYGGDAARIVSHVVDTQGCLLEGSIYAEVTASLSLIQQRLMSGKKEALSVEIYRLLHHLLANERLFLQEGLSPAIRTNLFRVEAYIDAHPAEDLSNARLASICGLSVSYFLSQFTQVYHRTPHQYVMQRRIARSRTLLLQTDLPVESIAEHLGFCNASHFIRQFRAEEHISPAQYRKLYSL